MRTILVFLLLFFSAFSTYGQTPGVNTDCNRSVNPAFRFIPTQPLPNTSNSFSRVQLDIHLDQYCVENFKQKDPTITNTQIESSVDAAIRDKINPLFEEYFFLTFDPTITLWNSANPGPFTIKYSGQGAYTSIKSNFDNFTSNSASAGDIGLLLTGLSMGRVSGYAGDSDDYLCSGIAKANAIAQWSNTPNETITIAHELAHILGVKHYTDFSQCGSCQTFQTAAIMCTQGGASLTNGFTWGNQLTVKHTLETINNRNGLNPQTNILLALGITNTGACIRSNAMDEKVANCPNNNRHSIGVQVNNPNPAANIGCLNTPSLATAVSTNIIIRAGCQRPTSFLNNNNKHQFKDIVIVFPSFMNITTFDARFAKSTSAAGQTIFKAAVLNIDPGAVETLVFSGNYVANSHGESVTVNTKHDYWGVFRTLSGDARIPAFSIKQPNPAFFNISGNISTSTNNISTLTDEIVTLNGNLNINKNITLDNCNVFLKGGYNIIVKSGNTLTIKGTSFQTCTTMWKGIIVEDGATLAMLTNVGGRKNEIHNAEYGIKYLTNNAITLAGGVAFYNNYVGIKVNGNFGSPTALNLSGCYFYGEASIAPYSGQPAYSQFNNLCGVIANNRNIDISNCTFNNLKNGMIAESSNLEIRSSNFNNIWYAASSATNPDFNDSGYAIYFNGHFFNGITLGGGVNGKINVSNVTNGAYIRNCNYALISDNVFANNNVGIDIIVNSFLSNIGSPSIIVSNNTLANIKKNAIIIATNESIVAGINNNSINMLTQDANSFSAAIDISGGMLNIGGGSSIIQQDWSVSNNKIELHEAKYGIYMTNSGNAMVSNNSIKIFDEDVPCTGIALNGMEMGTISQNCIERQIDGRAALDYNIAKATKGIYASGTSNTLFTNNVYAKTGIGAEFFGSCSSADGYQANAHIGNNTGVLVNNYAVMGTQDRMANGWDDQLMEGTNIQNTRQYQFIGRYESNQNEMKLSRFYIEQKPDWADLYVMEERLLPDGTIPVYPSSPADNFWYHPTTLPPRPKLVAGMEQSCSRLPTKGTVISCEYAESDVLISADEGLIGVYNEERAWELERQLYEKIQRCGTNEALPEINNFHKQAKTSNLGAFYTIKKDFTALFTMNETDENALKYNRIEIKRLLALTQQQKDQLSVSIAEASDELLAQYDNTLFELKSLLKNSNGLLKNATIDKDKLLQAKNRLSNISTKNAPEAYLKTIYEILIAQIENTRELSSEDLAQLRPIADDCPLHGGIAVYIARSLLIQQGERKEYDDKIICSVDEAPIMPKQPLRKQNIDNTSNISIYPNPTNGEVHIYNLNMEDESEITILDLNGKVMQKVTCNSNTYRINLESLQNGIYLISVQNGNKTQNAKIVLLK